MINEFDQPRDWEATYQDEAPESLPWFYPELDPDVAKLFDKLNLSSGNILDIGTGPGTQAIAIAKRGCDVLGVDISETAVKQAAERAVKSNSSARFIQDDILKSKLSGKYDFVLDRGVLHCFPPEAWPTYVDQLKRLLKTDGTLFIKCFSHLETREEGPPNRFSPENIEDIFKGQLAIESIHHSVYQGTLDDLPKTLVCILKHL